jgi:hypothetical protein
VNISYFYIFLNKLELSRGQLDKQGAVVGLDLRVKCGAVAADLSALLALVYDNKSASCIGLRAYRAQKSAAFVGAVAGVYVNVERAEAEGAVIARTCPHRENLLAAVGAYKSRVVLCKSFLFHIIIYSSRAFLSLVDIFTS